MAEGKRVTIYNQKEGKMILPPDPEELKKNPKAPPRELWAGRTIEVSAEEAAKLLNHKGLVDFSKMATPSASAAKLADLEKQLADEKAKNAELAKKLGEKEFDDDLEAGDDVEHKDGRKGKIKAVKGKKAFVDFGGKKADECLRSDLKLLAPAAAGA